MKHIIYEDNLLKMDGFDEAIIGIDQGIEQRLVYDIDKIALVLMTRDEMSEEDAYDYISYNITSTYVGDKTPLVIKLGTLHKELRN